MKDILTACPCPNQPDEKFTAPGSKFRLEFFLRKFLLFIRQFGEGFFAFSSLIDLFSKTPMLVVAWLITDCCQISQQISIVENQNISDLLFFFE